MSSRLERVIIVRSPEGLWDVIRERKENGEKFSGCRNLEEAFQCVRALYDENGELIEKKSNGQS